MGRKKLELSVKHKRKNERMQRGKENRGGEERRGMMRGNCKTHPPPAHKLPVNVGQGTGPERKGVCKRQVVWISSTVFPQFVYHLSIANSHWGTQVENPFQHYGAGDIYIHMYCSKIAENVNYSRENTRITTGIEDNMNRESLRETKNYTTAEICTIMSAGRNVHI